MEALDKRLMEILEEQNGINKDGSIVPGTWKPVVEALNKEGFRNTKGQEFSTNAIRKRYGRLKEQKEKTELPSTTTVTHKSPEEEVTETEGSTTTVVHLEESDAKALKEVLDWWKKREEGKSMEALKVRPDFIRGSETTTKTVRISKAMLKAAENKAKSHKNWTGGTFSSLVEVLLWEFLDRDPRFVEGPYYPFNEKEKEEDG